MIIVIIALLVASLLWATSTFIDKHLISNVTKDNDYKGLFIFSTLISSIIFLPIYLISSGFSLSISLYNLLIIFILAFCEVCYLIFYLKAIAKDDTSIITALFQFIPIVSYFLGLIFLDEIFSTIQIISGIVIILSTVTMSIKFEENKKFNKDKLWAMFFMFIASFVLAIQGLGFKVSALESNFSTTMFYFQAILLVIGMSTLLLKPFRNSFFHLMKHHGKKVLMFNIFNEISNSTANALKVYTLTLAPIAFVSAFQNSTQIIIAFLLGYLLTKIKPTTFDEDISRRTVRKKTICIIIAIVATIFFV